MAVMTKEEFAQHVKSDTLPMYRLAYSILQNSEVLVPDGRILYIGASGGFQGTTAWRSAEKILRRQCSIMSHLQNRVTINWRHRETDAASFKVPDC